MKQKKALRTSEESCVIIVASSTITTTEEAADYVKKFKHIDHKSVIGRFTSCTLVSCQRAMRDCAEKHACGKGFICTTRSNGVSTRSNHAFGIPTTKTVGLFGSGLA